jgi:hypothetical protein
MQPEKSIPVCAPHKQAFANICTILFRVRKGNDEQIIPLGEKKHDMTVIHSLFFILVNYSALSTNMLRREKAKDAINNCHVTTLGPGIRILSGVLE